ncbi:MAG: 50S ribosomal protein L5 [archaeon]
MSSIKDVRIEKVTLNIGVGESGEELNKAVSILKLLTGRTPIQTVCTVKQPTWKIRPGLAIGTKVTLRKSIAEDFLKKALKAKDNILKARCFSKEGNFGFGVEEYIELPGVKYDPKLGIKGFDVIVNLERKGHRIKRRKILKSKVGVKQRVSKDDAIAFMKEKFGVEVQ